MKYLFSLLRQRRTPPDLDRTGDVFIWIWHYFWKVTLWITFEVTPDPKIRELPIHEALTVLAARQLRMLLPGEEGVTGAEGRGPGSPAGSPTFSGLFIVSSSDHSVSSQGFSFLTCTLEGSQSLFSAPRAVGIRMSTILRSSLKRKNHQPPCFYRRMSPL